MGQWPGKYIIGLTGNIGTGKSVVRRMLEHLGAYGIDADTLSHRAIAKGAPGYQPVVDVFGRWILGADGQIDRTKLGKIVFADVEALAQLEKIIHPLVDQAIDIMTRRAQQKVVVIEAIKLFESSIRKNCDSIWVVSTSGEVQFNRLVLVRHMPDLEARQRIAAQPAQENKISLANVVIRNDGTFEETWKQVVTAWQRLVPVGASAAIASHPVAVPTSQPGDTFKGPLSVGRGKPRQAADIAEFLNRLRKDGRRLTATDIMNAFGEKAFILLQTGTTLVGALGWQVENLVARTIDIVLDPIVPNTQAIPALVQEMEQASRDLQCEASLVFVPKSLAAQEPVWRGLGYEPRTQQTLGVLAWQEAAIESQPANTIIYFKQLRIDRVMRPI